MVFPSSCAARVRTPWIMLVCLALATSAEATTLALGDLEAPRRTIGELVATLTDAEGVFGVQFDLVLEPGIAEVADVRLDDGPDGWSVAHNVLGAGTTRVIAHGSRPAPSTVGLRFVLNVVGASETRTSVVRASAASITDGDGGVTPIEFTPGVLTAALSAVPTVELAAVRHPLLADRVQVVVALADGFIGEPTVTVDGSSVALSAVEGSTDAWRADVFVPSTNDAVRIEASADNIQGTGRRVIFLRAGGGR